MEDWVQQLADYATGTLRPADGTVKTPSLGAEVEILTDRWGVPHVYAKNLDDLYFAQGWLHAAERFFQVDITRRLAQGRLAELFGELTLPMDRFFRTLGLGRTARSWISEIDADTERIGRPYFEGFRHAASTLPSPVEYQVLGIEPEIPETFEEAAENTFAIALLMAFTLSPNWDIELLRLWLAEEVGPERARLLSPLVGTVAPAAVPSSDRLPGLIRTLTEGAQSAGADAGVGSNNWVVSGWKSETGMPLLANDPHLKIQMPAIWMEMHLSCPDMDVAGVTLPGVAGVLIGHNRRIAWGFTNTQADVSDLYVERLSPDGNRYFFQDEWHDIEVIREEIGVRHSEEPHFHEVRLTRHGPLLDSILAGNVNLEVHDLPVTRELAFRWIHYDIVSSQSSVEGLNRAEDFEGFREAARVWPSAGQNMIYADVDGNIGYQFTGTVPIRPDGLTGAVPLIGWTGDQEWQGEVPFDELPCVFNPSCGYIATANNRVVDLDYPHHLTDDWEPSFRVRRIVSLLNSKEKLTLDDFARLQADTHSGIADRLVPLMLAAPAGNGDAKAALDLLAEWDRRMDSGSSGAALFAVWVTRAADRMFRERLGVELFDAYFKKRAWTVLWGYEALADLLENPDPYWLGGDGGDSLSAKDRLISETLAQAWQEVAERLGDDTSGWRWGRLHQVHFRHPLATAMPPLDELLSSGPFEAPGADDTVNRGVFNPGDEYAVGAISSYRQIIDLGDFDNSRAVISTGNSGNPASPHYRDQSEMWVTCEYHPMPFNRQAVEKEATGTLRLTP